QEPSSPPHHPPCPPQPQDAEVLSFLFQQVLDTCFALARRVEGLENDKAAQQLEIVKLKARVKKLENINMVKSSKLRRRKEVVIRDPEEELPSETPKVKDKGKGILIEAPKPMKKKDQ
nr:hypothetical protein [Tanacetum cinerariifolium]